MISAMRTAATTLFLAALAGNACAEISNEQAGEAFRGAQYRQVVATKSTLAVGCEGELKAGTYGDRCLSYRAAALEMLTLEEGALRWCRAKIEQQVAAAGGRTDIKVSVPPVCNAATSLDDRDQRISDLTAALNPAGAALAQQITAETKAVN